MYIIYTKENCPWCIQAKKLLEHLGFSYQEKHYGVDFNKDDLIALLPFNVSPTVRQVFFDGLA